MLGSQKLKFARGGQGGLHDEVDHTVEEGSSDEASNALSHFFWKDYFLSAVRRGFQ